MHPSADGAAWGKGSLLDFRRLTAVVSNMEGGVYLNVGSAVLLPEVFLKTVTLSRNLGKALKNITTANLDFFPHYRPMTNVVKRPTQKGGRGYALIGHHEILIPLLAAAVIEEWGPGRKNVTPPFPPETRAGYLRYAEGCLTRVGRVKENRDPSPCRLSTQMRPWCSSTRLLVIANPSPAPRVSLAPSCPR